MNNTQQLLQQERNRLRDAEQATQRRLDEQRQAAADARAVADGRAKVRLLEIQAREDEFNSARTTGNAPYLQTNHEVIAEIYAALDAGDMAKALELKPRLEQSFDQQQLYKRSITALMNDEFALAEETARHAQESMGRNSPDMSAMDRYVDEGAIQDASNGAYLRRYRQVQNAIAPGPALAAYVNSKPRGSKERQIAAGLCYAMCGAILDPSNDDYDPQTATDQQVLAPLQQPRRF